jgi:hypothetical protein
MRKSLWIILAVLLVAIAAPNAYADSFTDGTFSFTVTSGSPPPTGSFVYDNTTSTWKSFTIDWDGAIFNFAPLIPDPADVAPTGSWCAEAPVFHASSCTTPATFSLNSLMADPNQFSFTDGGALANGTYILTETVVGTPEPSSVALMLLGVGLLFVMRKRIGQRLPQAS